MAQGSGMAMMMMMVILAGGGFLVYTMMNKRKTEQIPYEPAAATGGILGGSRLYSGGYIPGEASGSVNYYDFDDDWDHDDWDHDWYWRSGWRYGDLWDTPHSSYRKHTWENTWREHFDRDRLRWIGFRERDLDDFEDWLKRHRRSEEDIQDYLQDKLDDIRNDRDRHRWKFPWED